LKALAGRSIEESYSTIYHRLDRSRLANNLLVVSHLTDRLGGTGEVDALSKLLSS
jgi:hypothetical protein